MKLILCIDDQNGMMFNHRMQSRDRVLIAELMTHVGAAQLRVSPYSVSLFPTDAPNVTVMENPCAAATAEDFVFVEDVELSPYWENVSELILYRWNRLYPSDVKFTEDMTKFQLISTTAFEGSSHSEITKEVWKR